MSTARSRRTVMVVTLLCIAGMIGLLAQSALAWDCCGCQPTKCQCDPCKMYRGCCGVPMCCGTPITYGAYQVPAQNYMPYMCVPQSCRPTTVCFPPACSVGPCLTTVQIAIGQGQPEAVRAWRWGNDVSCSVREVFQKLGAEVQYLGGGAATVTLNGKTVQLRAYALSSYWCMPAVGTPTGARMIGCRVFAPVAAVAAELGVTVDKQDSVIRLTP